MPDHSIKILITDDNADYATLLRSCLSLYDDLEVVGTLQSGHETLRFLDERQADILLLDIVMPDIDGLEVIRRNQASPTQCKPVIFVLSAVGEDTIIRQALHCGAARYLLKPIDIETIVGQIRSFHQEAKDCQQKSISANSI